MDRVFIRPHERFPILAWAMGAPADRGRLCDSSGRIGTETNHAAWRFLREPKVDRGQQARRGVLHGARADTGQSPRNAGAPGGYPNPFDRARDGNDVGPGGWPWGELQP